MRNGFDCACNTVGVSTVASMAQQAAAVTRVKVMLAPVMQCRSLLR
jgi:hypothetical protein